MVSAEKEIGEGDRGDREEREGITMVEIIVSDLEDQIVC